MDYKLVSAKTRRQRLIGMVDNSTCPNGELLVFGNCNSVHTFGMRKPLDIAFLDDQGKVLRVERNVKPLRLLYCRAAKTTVERRSNQHTEWLAIGDCLQLENRRAK
jgi:uncharacterized membrane protein (UPF0127 family)